MRMKEEYVEGLLETPTVSEQAIPEQLKSIVGQATGTLQQLPALIKDAFANGLKLPLSKKFLLKLTNWIILILKILKKLKALCVF